MKKIAFAVLFFASTLFADEIVLDNQSSYPTKNKKIAIQWATSAQEVDASNKALMFDGTIDAESMQFLTQKGEIELTIPPNVTYFRIVAWSNGEDNPEFSTNWIDIVPGTIYTLKTGHLVPIVLMSGMGC